MKPFHYHEDPMYAAAAAILASQGITEEAQHLEESYPGAPVLTKAQMLKKIDAREKQIMKMTEESELEESVEDIASAVEELKKGDKTNFGVVTDIGSNSISFKAKDLPITKIAFNQRKMGSKDFVLDKLVKLKEDVAAEEGIELEEANYTTTKISDDDYEIDVHTKPRYDKSWQDDAKNVNDVRPFVKTIITDIQKFNSDFEYATFLEALIKQIKKESADSDHAKFHNEALKDLNKALSKATVNFIANNDGEEPNYNIKPHIVKIIAKIDKVGVGYHYTVLLNALVKHLKTLSSESAAYKQLYKDCDKAVSVFNKELLEDVAAEEDVSLEEGNGSYGMGTATITAPGNKLHGKQVSVFHKFDDGRLNVQYAKSDKKGDVLNLTLNKGQYKLD